MTEPDRPIRDAATVVILRDGDAAGDQPRVLMGQRGQNAAFMPSKFVFPGGALDPEDLALGTRIASPDAVKGHLEARLRPGAPEGIAAGLALAAIREVWEETGLAIAEPSGDWQPPEAPSWASLAAAGFRPAPERLQFIFRAITPPGRPRRFDARFFLVEAGAVATLLDDFSRAEAELSHLSWVTLEEARALDLPFITGLVLAEIGARLAGAAGPVPFFHHGDRRSYLDAL